MQHKIRGSDLYSESAVYGLIVVSALLFIADEYESTSLEVFFQVLAATAVLWVAHFFAVTISHLNQNSPGRTTFRSELTYAMGHSLGLLIAAAVPLCIVLLGVANVVRDDTALWMALWVDVALLGLLGYFSARHWAPNFWIKMAVACGTALLGVFIIVLKATIH